MTAQVSDAIAYRGKDYEIAGINGKGLFDPTEHGMKPYGKASICWRGFLCAYKVGNDALWLDKLKVNLKNPAPVLFGVVPKPFEIDIGVRKIRWFDAVYEHLNYKVPYNGGLLLARDFIKELYVHMGFHPAWKYREVHELIFKDGQLVEERDCSQEIARLRQEMVGRPMKPDSGASRSERHRWIEQCFSQEYRW
jgi:hypothetical protein